MTDERGTPDEVWESFWKDIVCRPDGSLDLEQVKAELWDYFHLMGRASLVFDHVTGGRISKCSTAAAAVIAEADARTMEDVDRGIEDYRESLREG